MKLLAAIRYVLFAVFGVVIASALFFVLNVLISANYDASTGMIERWILRATCDRYALEGTVRDAGGRPVPFAIVEVSYPGATLTTRSNSDGTFVLEAGEAVCDRRPPTHVTVLVMAENYRPKRQTVPYDLGSLDVALDARDFRP
jgi:hypothetical protein